MPVYEYECERCCFRFELRRRFGEDGTGLCPQCGHEARRLFSPVPIIFRGSGFYATDSRGNQPPDGGGTQSKVDSDKSEKPADSL